MRVASVAQSGQFSDLTGFSPEHVVWLKHGSDEAIEARLQNPEGLERALTDPLTESINQLARAAEACAIPTGG